MRVVRPSIASDRPVCDIRNWFAASIDCCVTGLSRCTSARYSSKAAEPLRMSGSSWTPAAPNVAVAARACA